MSALLDGNRPGCRVANAGLSDGFRIAAAALSFGHGGWRGSGGREIGREEGLFYKTRVTLLTLKATCKMSVPP